MSREDPVYWAERHFHIEDRSDPDTGEELGPGPIVLAPHQRRIIRAALERDSKGRFRWSTIVYSAPKKSGKTRIAAMVAAWLAWRSGQYSEVYCLANDGKQSADRVLAAIKKAITLGGLEWRDIKTRIELPSGSFIEAIPVDPTGEAGANPTGTFWCLDHETEVLTRDGWKDQFAIRESDDVATLSKWKSFQWQRPRGIFASFYKGKMLLAETKRINMMVTHNHRIYAKCQNNGSPKRAAGKSYELIEAQDARFFSHCFMYPAPSFWVGKRPFDKYVLPGTKRRPDKWIPVEQWVAFLAWYLSEGCLLRGRKRRPEGVLIAQSTKKHENYEAIRSLLQEMGFRPRPRKNGSGFEVWDVRLANHCEQYGKAPDKFIPQWVKDLPTEDLELFLQTYRRGDGWDHGRGFDIGTVSERMRDDLLEIGQKCGYYTSYGGYVDPRSVHLQHKIRFRPGDKRVPVIRRHHWREVDYDGRVWCPSTQNGIILVRRKGTVYWTGNSEMWGFRLSAKERLWTEMTIPPTRHGRAIRWVESYAGYVGESPVLEQLYDQGVNEGKPHPDFPDLPVYVNERARLFCYWDTEARMAWQTDAYYQAEAALLTEGEFQRIHQNTWVASESEAIPIDMWDARQVSLPPRIHPKTPIVIGVDLGVSGDMTALSVVSKHPADNDKIAVRFVQAWAPPKGGKIDYSTTIEPVLERWLTTHNCVAVAYDEYQAHKMVTDMRKRGLGWFISFPQGKGTKASPGRPVADKMVYDMVMSGKLVHNGDPTLRQHVQNAAAKTVDEKNLRFIKKAPKLHIDLLVATSMAVATLSRLNV